MTHDDITDINLNSRIVVKASNKLVGVGRMKYLKIPVCIIVLPNTTVTLPSEEGLQFVGEWLGW